MDLFTCFAAAQKIADTAYDGGFYSPNIGSELPWLNDRRSEGVNPYYHQTRSGLFLEVYYGIPGGIWTPWGKWGCWGSGMGGGDLDSFLASFKLELALPIETSIMGSFGPVYAVLGVPGFSLPRPERHLAKGAFIGYAEANRQWEEMAQRFESSGQS